MTLLSSPLSLVLLILPTANALLLTPGSSCSSYCGDTSTTNTSDIVCSDFAYYSSGAGSTFMDCMDCLKNSNSTTDSENDLSWLLYNLRYASAVCIYDFPKHNTSKSSSKSASGSASISSCDLEYACAPLQGALEYGNLDPSNETEYGYCQADNNALYGTSIDDCVSCLQSSPSTYTGNFLLALKAGCEQEPAAGTLLSITGSLFSTSSINITVPSNTTSTTSSSGTSTISSGSIVAIVVSLGGVFLLATGLFVFYCCRQRRYAREDAQLIDNPFAPHPYHGKDQASISTVQSYDMPRYTVDYKSQLANANAHPFGLSAEPPKQGQSDGEFTSNADYYDRLGSRSRSQPQQAHPTGPKNFTPSVASEEVDAIGHLPIDTLPAHPAYIPRSITPGHLGGRASRTASRSVSRQPSTQSQTQGRTRRRSSAEQPQQQDRRGPNHKAASYAIQVYLNGPADEEPGASAARSIDRAPSRSRSRDVQAGGLVGPPEAYNPSGRQQTKLLYTPPSLSDLHNRSASPAAGLAPPDRAATATPNMASLILPSVPRIRVPGTGKTPPRLKIDDDVARGKKGISGPLAFPDSRFSMRPSNERIVSQTFVDRSGPRMEVPIASGKSFLYG